MNVKKARALIAISADAAGLDKGIGDAKKKLKGFAKGAKNILGKGAGLAKGGLGMLGAGLGIQAAGGLVELGANIIDVEKQLTRFQIAGEVSNDTMSEFREQLKNVSNQTGVSREELVKGAAAYVALTGDAAGAIEATRLFGEVAAGTGASMEDVSATAAALRQNLKINPRDFRKAFDVLVKQGKLGAIEIKDLAGKMANIAPQFSSFAGAESVEGMSELGSMLQVAKRGFGSADEAATGFNGMMTQLNRNQKKLKKLGVKVVDPKTGKFKNLLTLVREIGSNKKLMKPGALLDVLGEEKAVRAMDTLIKNLDEVDRIKLQSLNSDQVAKDNLAFQASTAGKLQRAMETAKNAIAEAFTPERIEKFANALVKIVDLLVKTVDLVENLFDDTGIEQMHKGDFVGALTAKKMKGTDRMSPAQKMARAAELEREAAGIESAGDMSGADELTAKGARAAAAKLRRQSDVWGAAGVSAQTGGDPKAWASAMAAALAKNPLVVKLGTATVTKEINKSTAHRQPGKR